MVAAAMSAPHPSAPKATPGTSREYGSNELMNLSTCSSSISPAEIMAFHSPML